MTYTGRKVWFVTGASSGLGRAVTVHLLEQGDRVVATLRKPKDISDLVAKYSEDQLLVVKLDVVSPSDIKTAFSQAIEKFGRVDVVYNNAGFAALAEVEGTPDELARSLFEVNFWGSTNVAREAVRVFRDVNTPSGGRLLQVSSMVGVNASAGVGFYSASKYAMEGVTQALANELDPSWNIKITLLEFGSFRTRPILEKGALPVAPVHPAYTAAELPTAVFRKFFAEGGVSERGGDANKVAREVYKLALDDSVGLRVPLGLDAIGALGNQLDTMRKDLEAAGKWSTDLKFEA